MFNYRGLPRLQYMAECYSPEPKTKEENQYFLGSFVDFPLRRERKERNGVTQIFQLFWPMSGLLRPSGKSESLSDHFQLAGCVTRRDRR